MSSLTINTAPFTNNNNRLNSINPQNNGGGSSDNAVLYVPQTLTDEQKLQALQNLGFSEELVNWIKYSFELDKLNGYSEEWLENQLNEING